MSFLFSVSIVIVGAIITALFGDMILYSLIKWLSVPVILCAIYKAFSGDIICIVNIEIKII